MGHEEICWAVEHLHRRGDLRGAAGFHDDQPVGHCHRLDLVVRDVERSDAKPPLQLSDFGAHGDAQFGVEIGKRLVEQKQFWLPHDRPADRHALALAAGKFSGTAL